MIMHTIVPDETLYDGIDRLVAPEEAVVNGVAMLVERTAGGHARVVRLLSPLPQHYLDDRFAPGSEITLGGGAVPEH